MYTLTLFVAAAESPDANDVVAGPVALLIFLLLALAVAFLGWSMTKQLRKAQAAKDAGAYGDEPVKPDSEPANGDSPTSI